MAASGGDVNGLLAANNQLDGSSTSLEGVEEIGDKYVTLTDVCSIKAVHSLVFYLAMIEAL